MLSLRQLCNMLQENAAIQNYGYSVTAFTMMNSTLWPSPSFTLDPVLSMHR